jgi:uncharacterized protein YegL
MKKDYTHLVGILDRSGSVAKVIDDMRGGYNAFLDEQAKLAGTCTVTTVVFDDEITVVDDFIDIYAAKRLNSVNYYARGMTALLDAVGKTVNMVGAKLSALPESDRPEFIVVYINTDGYENASREFNRAQINQMVKEQETKYNWKFLFLGANIDSFAEASSIGISNSASYVQTTSGVAVMSNNLNYSVKNLRSRGTLEKSLDVEDYFNNVQN